MKEYTVKPIGTVRVAEEETTLRLEPQYARALEGLDGFGYALVLWWFDGCDNAEDRASLAEEKPYAKGPDTLGAFATRSPRRPNPIAVSCARVLYVNMADGTVGLDFIDADDGSPVLDIKPYTPSLDRVESPITPGWCAHWPQSREESGAFDWEAEFNF